jgi:hypothetical protein
LTDVYCSDDIVPDLSKILQDTTGVEFLISQAMPEGRRLRLMLKQCGSYNTETISLGFDVSTHLLQYYHATGKLNELLGKRVKGYVNHHLVGFSPI